MGAQKNRLIETEGAQWLSGRVLDSRPKGCGFEPHRRHCVVVLEQDTFTGPRNAVCNVSGNRCESDCRSRGREFDPGPVPYFRGD